jgi:hypothetical protein
VAVEGERLEDARMGAWFLIMLSFYGLPLLIYLAFAVPALYYLRERDLDDAARAVWALAIVAVPVMGAIAFAVVVGPSARQGPRG